MIFPSCDQPAVVLQAGEQALDLPSAATPVQRPFVLSDAFAPGSIGRNHLDSILVSKLLVERIGVICLVADHSFGQLVEEASGENTFHKSALGRRSAFHRYGDRKTVTRGDSDDLGTLAAPRWTNGEAPF